MGLISFLKAFITALEAERARGAKAAPKPRPKARKKTTRRKKAVSAKKRKIPAPSSKRNPGPKKAAVSLRRKTSPAGRKAGKTGDMLSLGTVTHYFDKISVAIIKLQANLKIGDRVLIADLEGNFSQTVKSMQINRQDVNTAGRGDLVGIKVIRPVRVGSKVCGNR